VFDAAAAAAAAAAAVFTKKRYLYMFGYSINTV